MYFYLFIYFFTLPESFTTIFYTEKSSLLKVMVRLIWPPVNVTSGETSDDR